MDENLVIHAIQWERNEIFKNRYTFFPNKRDRDETFDMLRAGQDPEARASVSPVTMIIRVETEDIPEDEDREDLIHRHLDEADEPTELELAEALSMSVSEFRVFRMALRQETREVLAQRVKDMKAAGLTNIQISEALGMSESSTRTLMQKRD